MDPGTLLNMRQPSWRKEENISLATVSHNNISFFQRGNFVPKYNSSNTSNTILLILLIQYFEALLVLYFLNLS